MDNTIERTVYGGQISKKGTADGVVGDADEEDPPPKDFDRNAIENMSDPILGCVMNLWGKTFTKDPSQHDTLQLGGQEWRLSKEEKENAERRFQQEKSACSTQHLRQNSSSHHPELPVLPAKSKNPTDSSTRPSQIPSQVHQQHLNLLVKACAQSECKEMVLTRDVTMERPAEDGESTPIVLPTGSRIKLIETPRGIFVPISGSELVRINPSALSTTAGTAFITDVLETTHIRQDLIVPNKPIDTETGKSSTVKPKLERTTGTAEVGAGCSQSASSLKPSSSKRPSTLFVENVDSELLWISDLGTASGFNSQLKCSDFPTSDNDLLLGGASASSQVNWQWPQQQEMQQVDPIFGSANSEVDMSPVAGSSHQYSTSDFQNYYDFPTSSASTMYPSHSLPPAGHYTPSSFVTNAPTYATNPPNSDEQNSGPSDDFPPSPQPYNPDSFSQ